MQVPVADCSIISIFPVLHNCDIAIDGQVREAVNLAAGLWPLYFQPVNLCPFADAEYDPRIMSRQITSAAHFHAAAFEIACLVCNSRTNSIRVCFFSNQIYAKPMIVASDIVLQK